MHLPQRRRLQTIIMIVSLFFSFFSMQRQVPEVPSCAASTVTRKLHSFLRLHLNLFRGRGRGFCDEEQTAAPHHQWLFLVVFPPEEQRKKKQTTIQTTSNKSLCPLFLSDCLLWEYYIYTTRKLCFILYNWRGKEWRKCSSQLTKRGISERHQPPHASHGINLVVSCTSSEARRLRSCTRTLPEMLSHQGTCRLCSWQNRYSKQKVLE